MPTNPEITALARDQIAHLDHLAYRARLLETSAIEPEVATVQIEYVDFTLQELAAIARHAQAAIRDRQQLWRELLR